MEKSSLSQGGLPHNIEAEKAVLGAIMIDSTKIGAIASIINDNDFYLERHQILYRVINQLYDKDNLVDPLAISDILNSLDLIDKVGGIEYIVELWDVTPSTAHAEKYAQIVREKSILRQLIHASDNIRNLAVDENDELINIVDRSEQLILQIGDRNQENSVRPIRPIITEAFERLEELSKQQKDVVGLPTGYIQLDKLTTGFHPDQLIIIAARPSVGKTAFALNIAQNIATKQKVPVVIFSLEMGALDLVNRIICAEGNINATNLRTGQLTSDEWNSFTLATNQLADAPIFIDDTPGIKVSEIRAKSRRLKQEHPDLGLIVIDYLQLIDGSGRSENRQQEVSEISRQLKKLAKELGVPVIALSQLSRGVEHRQNKRPILADIRESGSIEQDADIVAFLYREDYYQQEDEDEAADALPNNVIEVIVAKNRSGARDTVKLLFKKEYNKFSSLMAIPDTAIPPEY